MLWDSASWGNVAMAVIMLWSSCGNKANKVGGNSCSGPVLKQTPLAQH